ncbi:unnamed protein product [Cylicostephanus goldi]|uniref:Amiloride-sensitive sodium channel n=1 Tax=Cylicostephanus goldi TaxID=71465 RepID=A0A3P6RLQ8_CYLGO|nr:unnamed protein product [Cylicostephanus goldi]
MQIVLDAHLEEQFDGTGEPIFSDDFENGFRYFVHAPETIPYLVSEGISVSPSTRVYSAISTNTYVLLPAERWGNCTSKWPKAFHSKLPYSSVNCDSICKAMFFKQKCGCSPFTYDIEHCRLNSRILCEWRILFVCNVDYYDIPRCKECQIECDSIVYHAYNSYGHGFSNGALTWLNKKNKSWSIPHMKTNFLTVNVFFRDMSYMEYVQVQGTTLTETLSDIGGNMGLFLGMSVITVVEILMYFSKIGWITFSSKRRLYMYRKKEHEKVIFPFKDFFREAAFTICLRRRFQCRASTLNSSGRTAHCPIDLASIVLARPWNGAGTGTLDVALVTVHCLGA